MRHWHQSSNSIFLLPCRGWKAKNYISQVPYRQDLDYKSIFSISTPVRGLKNRHKGRTVFPAASTDATGKQIRGGRNFSSVGFQSPVFSCVTAECWSDGDDTGVFLIVSLPQRWCVLQVNSSISELLKNTLFLRLRERLLAGQMNKQFILEVILESQPHTPFSSLPNNFEIFIKASHLWIVACCSFCEGVRSHEPPSSLLCYLPLQIYQITKAPWLFILHSQSSGSQFYSPMILNVPEFLY